MTGEAYFNPASIDAVMVLDGSREAEACAAFDEACTRDGLLVPVPAEIYACADRNDLAIWCVRRGFYCLPTLELIDFLRKQIAGDSAIEIAAGHGAIGRALGIPRSDSKQQDLPEMIELFKSIGQGRTVYPADVEKLTAAEAVKLHDPEVVIAAWATHRYDPRHHERGGNVHGIDHIKLLHHRSVQRYIFIGHERVHRHMPILQLKHETQRPPFLFSRPLDPLNVIWIWT